MIGLYRGTSWPVSALIKFFSRSPYSHAAWIEPDGTTFESWNGRVRCGHNYSKDHTAGTKIDLFDIPSMTEEQHSTLMDLLWAEEGKGYDYWGVAHFIWKQNDKGDESKWFCSEYIADCLNDAMGCFIRKDAWRTYPCDLCESPLAVPAGFLVC